MLSTLPDNPRDSRFWAVSHGLQGRFPLSQNFRKFRFDRKWKTFHRFVLVVGRPVYPVGTFLTEIRVPFTCTRFSYLIPVPIFTNSTAIMVSHRVTGSSPFRGLRSNGTTFYLSEIFGFFGKRPRLEYEISRIVAESLLFLVDSTLTLRTAVVLVCMLQQNCRL